MGENLNYTVGSLRYSNASDTNNDISSTNNDDSTTNTNVLIIIITITAILVIGIITIIIIISFCIVKKQLRKSTSSLSGNADINMYASPAYGTHHVFAEPGMDHLYEPIDDYLHKEESTTLHDAPQADDDEAGIDYIIMNPSFKAVDQAVTDGSVGNTESHTMSDTTDEYVQAADNHLPTAINESDEDDGYENDDQKKNDYF